MLGLGDQLRVALNLDHDGGRVPRPVVRPAPTLAAVADGVGDEGGIVGVAHEASLAMFRMGFGFEASASQTEAALQQMVNVDVVNSSWTYGEAFTDNKNELKSAEFFEAIVLAL